MPVDQYDTRATADIVVREFHALQTVVGTVAIWGLRAASQCYYVPVASITE